MLFDRPIANVYKSINYLFLMKIMLSIRSVGR